MLAFWLMLSRRRLFATGKKKFEILKIKHSVFPAEMRSRKTKSSLPYLIFTPVMPKS